MQYTNPTTQAEMYTALKEIFFYYRIKRQSFENVNLVPLNLTRLSYTELSSNELLVKAQLLNQAEQYAYRAEYIDKINQELSVVNSKLSNLSSAYQAKVQKVNVDYSDSEYKIETNLSKNGLSNSNIALDKIAQLEVEKNRLLSELQTEYQNELSELNARQTYLNNKLNGADAYCAEKATKENYAKQNELLDEQAKIVREVAKFNVGLSEKEQRYANTILETRASLELKFLSIQAGEFTKDQLVEMGYYEDVINCVCAYYDTLETLVAANQIMRDKKLIEYLDDYYESVVYMYQQRALA